MAIGRALPLAVALGLVLTGNALAADADLDPSFSGDGTAASSAGTFSGRIALQPDGKIVQVGTNLAVTGDTRWIATRTNPAGTPDASFSGDGVAQVDFGAPADAPEQALDVAMTSGGKLVLVGAGHPDGTNASKFALARLNANGTLDSGFAGGGKLLAPGFCSIGSLTGAAVQADSELVVAGWCEGGASGGGDVGKVARYSADGDLDSAFNDPSAPDFGDDVATGGAFLVGAAPPVTLVQPTDQKIVVVGGTDVQVTFPNDVDFYLARTKTDGDADTGFDGDGKLLTDFSGGNDTAYDAALQADGKIVAVGYATNAGVKEFAIARYNAADGSLDTTFNPCQIGQTTPCDGKETIGFGSGGATATGVAIDPGDLPNNTSDDEIVVAGYIGGLSSGQQTALVRLNENGSLDTSFAGDGKLTSAEEPGCVNLAATDVTLDSSDRIVVGGVADLGGGIGFGLARYGTSSPLPGPPDCTPPNTSVVSGPSGPTTDHTPTFGFASSEAGSSFRCAVDGGAFGACSGPGQTDTLGPLADGPHTFRVVATDAHANVDSSPAARSFTVTTPAPPGGGGGGGSAEPPLILNGCLNADAKASTKSLGPAKLGRKQKAERAIFKGASLHSRKGLDRYCAVGGGAFRIGYPTKRLLKAAKKKLARKVKGRVVLILTSSKRFSVKGKRPGSKARGLHGKHLKIGRNTWYYAGGKLIVVRKKKVVSVGISDKRLLKSKRLTRKFLTAWKLGT